MQWNSNRSIWQGECPVCGINSFFSTTWEGNFTDYSKINIVECPGGHPFIITTHSGSKSSILSISPINGNIDIPSWLPTEYEKVFSEMMFDLKSQKYRSAVAMASIILDVHINSLLINPGDKRKPLAQRMEILSVRKLIDQDQFADGTVARLGRNEVLHPETISVDIEEHEAKEAVDSVIGCLERYYKFRRAKALPAPAEQVGEIEKVHSTETSPEGEAPKA